MQGGKDKNETIKQLIKKLDAEQLKQLKDYLHNLTDIK